jgi:glutamyl-tRNA synthetase
VSSVCQPIGSLSSTLPVRRKAIRFKVPASGARVRRCRARAHFLRRREHRGLRDPRSDQYPTYHLSVVVDDTEMGITDVIRGDDHISNTPKHVLLFQALGASVPRFAHVPLILGADKKRLSKRHGATSVMEYQRQGTSRPRS